MEAKHWPRVEMLFQAALQRPQHERSAFLQKACDGELELEAEVESLLASHEQAGDFLDEPLLMGGEAAAPTDPVESLTGRLISHYQVLREIGQGGIGVVYLAERADAQYEKRVAIKLIKRGMDTGAIVRRFCHERQMLADLEHPNIARLIDSGTTEDGRPYFIMEYVDGIPLDDYCRERGLSVNERLVLFRTVCAAVHAAHQNLIVHRDLKPSNILVTADGVPKLLDFGIAKWLQPEPWAQTRTSTGLRPMTPEYASPEQVRGGPITTASDVYSLGVLLYQLLTGHRPYPMEGRSLLEVERLICDAEPERPSASVNRVDPTANAWLGGSPDDLRRRLTGDLDTIVLMALRKETARRYASAQELSEDIRRHLEGLPVIARKDTLGYLSGKFARRNKVAVAAATLVLLSLTLGLVATTWQARRATQQRMRAEQQELSNRRMLYVAQMNLAFQAFDQANIGLVNELLEGQRPKSGQQDLRGFEWYYLSRLLHRERLTWTHRNPVEGLAFSPDGAILALAGVDGLTLWDIASHRQLAKLPAVGGGASAVSFSLDGRTLALGHYPDHTVQLWNVAKRERQAILAGHRGSVDGVAFSPDGKMVASTSRDLTVKLWDVAAEKELTTLKGRPKDWPVLSFSPDGRLLATAAEGNVVALWDVNGHHQQDRLKGHQDQIASAVFFPDGKILASGSADKTIKLWDIATRRELASLAGHSADVSTLAVSPDGKLLASGGRDNNIKLWDVASRHELTTLKGHIDGILAVVFSPDGKTLASSGHDSLVKLWDVAEVTEEPLTLRSHTQAVAKVAFSPEGRILATAGMEGTAKLWEVKTHRELTTLHGPAAFGSVAFSPDGKTLATGSLDGTARIWDMSTKKDLRILNPKRGALHSVQVSPDGKLLAAGADDSSVVVWDTKTRQAWPPLLGHTARVWAVSFSPDSRLLASASWDGSVRLWDLALRQHRQTIPGSDSLVFAVAFSPDGKLLAIGYVDGVVRLWDVTTRQYSATLKAHVGWIDALTFSPDGKRLVTGGCHDRTIKLWDLVTKQVVATLQGHRGPISSVAFSPDGRILATASQDHTVKLWYGGSAQKQ